MTDKLAESIVRQTDTELRTEKTVKNSLLHNHAQTNEPWSQFISKLGSRPDFYAQKDSDAALLLSPNTLLTVDQASGRSCLVEELQIEQIEKRLKIQAQTDSDKPMSLDAVAKRVLQKRKRYMAAQTDNSIVRRITDRVVALKLAGKIHDVIPGKEDEVISQLVASGNPITEIDRSINPLKQLITAAGGFEGYRKCDVVLAKLGLDAIELLAGEYDEHLSDRGRMTIEALIALSQKDGNAVDEILSTIYQYDPSFLDVYDSSRLITTVYQMIDDEAKRSQIIEIMKMQVLQGEQDGSQAKFHLIDTTTLDQQITQSQEIILSRLLHPGITNTVLKEFPELVPQMHALSRWNIAGLTDDIYKQKGPEGIAVDLARLDSIFQNEDKRKKLAGLYAVLNDSEPSDPYKFQLLVAISEYLEQSPEELVKQVLKDQKVDKAIILLQELPTLFPEKGVELLEHVVSACVEDDLISVEIQPLFEAVKHSIENQEGKVVFYRYLTALLSMNNKESLEKFHMFLQSQSAALGGYVARHDDMTHGFNENFLKELVRFNISNNQDTQAVQASAPFLLLSDGDETDISRNKSIQAILQGEWFASTHQLEAQKILLSLLDQQDLARCVTDQGQFTKAFIEDQTELVDTEPWRYFSLLGNLDTTGYGEADERDLTNDLVQFINRIDIAQLTMPMAKEIWSFYIKKKQDRDSELSADEIFWNVLKNERDVGSVFQSYIARHDIQRDESPSLYVLKTLTQDLPCSRQAQNYYYSVIRDILFENREQADRLIAKDGRISGEILEDLAKTGSIEESVFFILSERCNYTESDYPMAIFLCTVHQKSPLDNLTNDMLMYLVKNQQRWTTENGNISADVLTDLINYGCDTNTFFAISQHIPESSGKDRTLAKLETLREMVQDDDLILQYYQECIKDGHISRYTDENGNLNEEFMNSCLRTPEYRKLLLYAYNNGAVLLQPGSKHAIYLDYIGERPEFTDEFLNHSESLGLYDESLGSDEFKQKIEVTQDAIIRVSRSPSRELRRIAPEIIDSIMNSANPEIILDEIEAVFVRNNLPYIGKIFLTFDILFPDKEYEEVLRKNNKLSPVLRTLGAEGKQLIFKDLLSIHIESGNRSLEQFLNIFHSADLLIEQRERNGEESLTPEQLEHLDIFLMKAELVTKYARTEVSPSHVRTDRISAVADAIGVRDDQTISNRLVELYAKPLGYRSVGDILDRITHVRIDADKRSRKRVEECDGKLSFAVGDLVKGVNSSYIAQILQNGSVAKEFLGGAFQRSDLTPFDTDVSRIDAITEDFNTNLQMTAFGSSGTEFGDLGIIFRERTDESRQVPFLNTTGLQPEDSDSYKRRLLFGKHSYELFDSVDNLIHHHGIRTGIAMTEAAFLIANDSIATSATRLDELRFQIAKNGYYIPITDLQGNLLFTPEQYDAYRVLFRGIDIYHGAPYEYLENSSEITRQKVYEVQRQLSSEYPEQQRIISQVQNEVDKIFNTLSLQKQTELTGIAGVSIHDTGSTSRGTNIPGNADFDFVIELDDIIFEDGKTVQALQTAINDLYPGAKEIYARQDRSIQMHAIQAQVNGKDIELDFGIIKRPAGASESTEKVLSMIYRSIEEDSGSETVSAIRANISFAKQFLTDHGIYKGAPGIPGGLGGIGVEYWILQHSGSFDEARKSFLESALDEHGEIIDYEEFVQHYSIWDVGLNLLNDRSENLLPKKINKETYIKMVDVLQKYDQLALRSN